MGGGEGNILLQWFSGKFLSPLNSSIIISWSKLFSLLQEYWSVDIAGLVWRICISQQFEVTEPNRIQMPIPAKFLLKRNVGFQF